MGKKGRYLILVLAVALFYGAYGCSFWDDVVGSLKGQAAKKAFETRTIDAGYKDVYSASVESMFDLGYTVTHSDEQTGIVVGEKNEKRYVNTSGLSAEEKRRAENEFDALQLTILVKPAGKKQAAVRIKTAWNKRETLKKKAIDQIWVNIQRQVMMEDVTQR